MALRTLLWLLLAVLLIGCATTTTPLDEQHRSVVRHGDEILSWALSDVRYADAAEGTRWVFITYVQPITGEIARVLYVDGQPRLLRLKRNEVLCFVGVPATDGVQIWFSREEDKKCEAFSKMTSIYTLPLLPELIPHVTTSGPPISP